MTIRVTEFMSLDGVVQAPGGPEEDTDGGFEHGGWSMPFFDPETWVPLSVLGWTRPRRSCWAGARGRAVPVSRRFAILTTQPCEVEVSSANDSVLLSGGNPQIAKADGDAPVQAYIAAMPGWKGDIGRQIDSLVVSTIPEIHKAVRWNSPFYGIDGNGWFLSFHCFTKYVKVTFLNGGSLQPLPPETSKQPSVRYLHVSEDQALDETQFVEWVKQASALPGDALF